MLKQHVLLEKAFIYANVDRKLTPEGCSYDRKAGLWRLNHTGEVMMTSHFAKKPATKKCDVETGEDQKGE